MADEVTFRTPSVEDGTEIWKMVDEAAALDANSAYTYVMICRNFAATSVVAEVDGDVAGMITAYPLPDDPTRLFVWQVNVREDYQGKGIAGRMLSEILSREECAGVRYVETTIEPGNAASEALFSRFAEDLDTHITRQEVFRDELFPDAEHKIEQLFVIGPIGHAENQIQIRREADGYRLYAILRGHEQEAFTPVNPAFTSLDDAERAAEAVRESHFAREIVVAPNE